jgi:hypothetical protein
MPPMPHRGLAAPEQWIANAGWCDLFSLLALVCICLFSTAFAIFLFFVFENSSIVIPVHFKAKLPRG